MIDYFTLRGNNRFGECQPLPVDRRGHIRCAVFQGREIRAIVGGPSVAPMRNPTPRPKQRALRGREPSRAAAEGSRVRIRR